QQLLGIFQFKDVGRDATVVRVGFLDDGAIELWRQLFVLAVTAIHPNFDDVDTARYFFAHRGTRFFFRGDPMRFLPATWLRGGDAATRRAVERNAGSWFIAHRKYIWRQIETQAECSAYTVSGALT